MSEPGADAPHNRVGPDLDRIHAVLSSPTATSWVRLHAAGSGLSHDSVRLTPSLLASIPL